MTFAGGLCYRQSGNYETLFFSASIDLLCSVVDGGEPATIAALVAL
jgi:hypothetical protein